MIIDTERALKLAKYKKLEAKVGAVEDRLRDKTAQGAYLVEKAFSFNNWGRLMTAKEFEGRLKKLNPAFIFEDFTFEELKGQVLNGYPANTPWHHKRLLVPIREEIPGEATPVFQVLYPRELIPEHSITKVKEDFLPNPEFMSTGKTPELSDFSVNPTDWNAKPSKDSNLVRWFYEQGGVELRGWRSVLLILMDEGFLTLAQVEKEFGSSPSPEWVRKVYGKETRVAVQL
jgi:hypothetical protein